MKKLIHQISLLLFAGLLFISCKKDEHQVVFEGGTAPILSANKTATIPMAFLTKDQEAVRFD